MWQVARSRFKLQWAAQFYLLQRVFGSGRNFEVNCLGHRKLLVTPLFSNS